MHGGSIDMKRDFNFWVTVLLYYRQQSLSVSHSCALSIAFLTRKYIITPGIAFTSPVTRYTEALCPWLALVTLAMRSSSVFGQSFWSCCLISELPQVLSRTYVWIPCCFQVHGTKVCGIGWSCRVVCQLGPFPYKEAGTFHINVREMIHCTFILDWRYIRFAGKKNSWTFSLVGMRSWNSVDTFEWFSVLFANLRLYTWSLK